MNYRVFIFRHTSSILVVQDLLAIPCHHHLPSLVYFKVEYLFLVVALLAQFLVLYTGDRRK